MSSDLSVSSRTRSVAASRHPLRSDKTTGERWEKIVVFLSADYQGKNWCGIEFRAVREIIALRENNRIMLIRTDDGAVEGVFDTDGYVDARRFTPEVIARFIQERAGLV